MRAKISVQIFLLVLLLAVWHAAAQSPLSASLYQAYLAGRSSGAWLFSIVQAVGSQSTFCPHRAG